ncbi:hypothetical protein E2C01_016181 [Portunus trituberculatus]|uniref:Uncharacterized protein n=1 Tax=Portunus trituberculatus TaxID=210409 RepID=A0A5B7DNE9_PORTR|nr:hypothetical protein [Portunus trituberculatus]
MTECVLVKCISRESREEAKGTRKSSSRLHTSSSATGLLYFTSHVHCTSSGARRQRSRHLLEYSR